MFLSNTQNSDYDYKKKQENLNVNKNRVTAYDHILPDNNPAQRLVAEEEEEQRQKEVAQLKKEEEIQLKPVSTTDNSPVQMRIMGDRSIEDEVNWVVSANKGETNSTSLLMIILDTMIAAKGLEPVVEQNARAKMLRINTGGAVLDDDDLNKLRELIRIKLRKNEIIAQPAEARPIPPYGDNIEREAAFVYNNSDTWEINEVSYLNGTDAALGGATDAVAKIEALSTGSLRGNTKTTSNSLLLTNTLMHNHLELGSKGIAFYYKKEADGRITPYVIDIARSRLGNKYRWETGGAPSFAPTGAALP